MRRERVSENHVRSWHVCTRKPKAEAKSKSIEIGAIPPKCAFPFFSCFSLRLTFSHSFYRRLSSSSSSSQTLLLLCVIVITVALYADLRLCRSNGSVFSLLVFSTLLYSTHSLRVLFLHWYHYVYTTKHTTRITANGLMWERDCEPRCLNINVCVYKLNTKRRSDVMRVNGSIIAHLKEIENGTERNTQTESRAKRKKKATAGGQHQRWENKIKIQHV